MIKLAVFFLTTFVVPSAFAEVCRWKDPDGRTHYGVQAPDGVACERRIRVRAPVTRVGTSGAAGGPDYAVLENEFQRRRLSRLEAEIQEEEARLLRERHAEACIQAQGRYNWLQAGGRAMQVGAGGERHYLDEAERSNEITVAQQKVTYYCR